MNTTTIHPQVKAPVATSPVWTTIRSVLVVEDNAAARDGLGQMLQLFGLQAVGAADGEEALAMLAANPVDVVLTDIWMPRVNGLELIARLGGLARSPKVIVMTADDTPETLLMTLRQKARQFVRKPIQAAALVQLLQTLDKSAGGTADIEVISARPAWIELVVSCGSDVADRIESYVVNLDVDLPREVREVMGQVFRELLLDVMDCDGTPDPTRKLRVSYLRARRMLMYRIGEASSVAMQPTPLAAARLQPGGILARAQADELLYNEARTEVVVVKYLD